jgi:hypothetical protein
MVVMVPNVMCVFLKDNALNETHLKKCIKRSMACPMDPGFVAKTKNE